MEPLIGLKHLGGTKYTVAVFNRSDKAISLGEMDSALGFDEFLVTIKTTNDQIEIKRKSLIFTADVLRPLVIPSGSYHEIRIDLSDGTWDFGGHKAVKQPDSWKAIKVFYQPQACALLEERKRKGILGTGLESMWVGIVGATAK